MVAGIPIGIQIIMAIQIYLNVSFVLVVMKPTDGNGKKEMLCLLVVSVLMTMDAKHRMKLLQDVLILI